MSKERTRYLLNDVCRCHDLGCSRRTECLRFLLRTEMSETTPHATTLGHPCDDQIAIGCGEWIRWRGGEKPIDHNDVNVQVEFAGDGDNMTGRPSDFHWEHSEEDSWANIVAFRVLEDAP